MASKVPSIETKHDLEQFLRSNGYVSARIHRNDGDGNKKADLGKGSHMLWSHPDMARLLAEGRNIKMPQNLRSSDFQEACNVMTCSSPARGTINTIVKQVLWCVAEVERQRAPEQESRRDKIVAHRQEAIGARRTSKKSLSMLKRSLCQAFKKAGPREAEAYAKKLAPDLRATEFQMSLAHSVAEGLKSTLTAGIKI